MSKVKKILAIALALVMIAGLFAACSASPEKQLLGAWRNSTGTMGYEFKEGNVCAITYADITIPIINIKYNGTVDGAYTTEKGEDGNYYVTVTYTILSSSISERYMYKVDGQTLTLTNTDSGKVVTLVSYTEPSQTTIVE